MSACAHFLSCFPKDEQLLSLRVVQMVGWKLEHLEVKGHEPT
jgi:hypothetical protein